MKKNLREHVLRNFYKIESSHFTSIVRRGFTMMMPILVVGAMACAILYFPSETFRQLITERYEVISIFLETVYGGTFGIFSMLLVVALSVSYAMEKSTEVDKRFFYCIVAVTCYGTQISMADEETMHKMLAGTGCFFALIIGLLSCFMFSRLQEIESISLKKYTMGMEIVPANAIQCIFPAAITIGTFVLVSHVITTMSGEENLYMVISGIAYRAFKGIGNNFGSAMLYTIMIHVFWVLGFHGGNMLESVAVDNFSVISGEVIFSKSFFDTFVIMGGCGTSICVLIGLCFFVRKKRLRSLGKIAFPTVLFNANEILSYGIPLVLNPIMAIPFIFVPVMSLIVSYAATALGLVPIVSHEIIWTMPPFISGYLATGSIAGSILQLVIIALGVLMYVPFLRMYEDIYELRMQDKIDRLVEKFQECEEKGEIPDFLHRVDDYGMVVRMLLQDLKTALKRKKLYLLYQPQMDREGGCIGAEALIRWQHPEYGFIYPPLIIYLATAGEILQDMEKELVDMSVKAVRQVSQTYHGDFKISINLTAHSLNWEIDEYIKKKMEEYQAPAEKLWLEITEQDILNNSEQAIEKMQRLKAAGHKLLIDDFGMGHTSLIYLKSDYFDGVKLDGSLIHHVVDREIDQKIVASVMELSKQLGISVIAEYVETEEQHKKLEELGYCYYQGYLYGKPLVLEQFIKELRKNSQEDR